MHVTYECNIRVIQMLVFIFSHLFQVVCVFGPKLCNIVATLTSHADIPNFFLEINDFPREGERVEKQYCSRNNPTKTEPSESELSCPIYSDDSFCWR